jgi:hypothetical protein
MGTCYCSTCANARGLKMGIDGSNPLGTTGQRAKFGKHTTTSGSSNEIVRTVFSSTHSSDYVARTQATITFGFVQFLGRRKNIVYVPSTGSALGVKLVGGVEVSRPDAIVAVNTSQSTGLHIFLEDSSKYSTSRCVNGCKLW